MQSILEKAGIHPSNHESYPVGKVKYEIKQAVGALPDIQCTGDKINEVHFCLERDLRVRILFSVYLRSGFFAQGAAILTCGAAHQTSLRLIHIASSTSNSGAIKLATGARAAFDLRA